MISFYIF